jgi:hypothetical protein
VFSVPAQARVLANVLPGRRTYTGSVELVASCWRDLDRHTATTTRAPCRKEHRHGGSQGYGDADQVPESTNRGHEQAPEGHREEQEAEHRDDDQKLKPITGHPQRS